MKRIEDRIHRLLRTITIFLCNSIHIEQMFSIMSSIDYICNFFLPIIIIISVSYLSAKKDIKKPDDFLFFLF